MTLTRFQPQPVRLNTSQQLVLRMLREGPTTTSDFLRNGAGGRFGGRIKELRDMGFVIDTAKHTGGATYTLIRDIERDVERTAGPATADRSLDAHSASTPPRSDPPVDQAPRVDNPTGGRSAAEPSPQLFDPPERARPGFMDYDEEDEAA